MTSAQSRGEYVRQLILSVCILLSLTCFTFPAVLAHDVVLKVVSSLRRIMVHALNLFNWLGLVSISHNDASEKYIPGKPLVLTPFLDSGQVLEAQRLAKVSPASGGVQSYSGFFTVDEECGSNLFFWFVLAETDWNNAPVLLWMNGGPGASSLYGLFFEIGPWKIEDGELVKRENAWTKIFNVIFLDQPVGTGFSFLQKDCYAKDMSDVARSLHSFLVQFFTMFPDLQQNRLFMSGMSFAGHYIPEAAELVDKLNSESEVKINLAGIIIGSGAFMYTCQTKSDLLYELGIIDNIGKKELKDLEEMIKQRIQAKDYKGVRTIDYQLHSKLPKYGLTNYHNVLDDKDLQGEISVLKEYVEQINTRRQLHVGETPYVPMSTEVFKHLSESYYQSSIPSLEYLLEKNLTVVLFHGQLDAICSYSSLMCVLQNTRWSGADQFWQTASQPWRVSGRLAGWFKGHGALLTAQVRNAGHHVSADQGLVSLTLVTAVVNHSTDLSLLNTFTDVKVTPA